MVVKGVDMIYTKRRNRSRRKCAILTAQTLGKFQLSHSEKRLDEDTMRSDMLARLLLYLLLHREHPNTIQELSEALWDEEETENPAGALKNLMYRLRNLLKKHLDDREFIVTGRGTYSWNAEIPVWLDVEQFVHCCENAKRVEESEEQIRYYESALSLYQGDFMVKIGDKHWVATLAAYYHSLWDSAIKALAGLYLADERYEDVERICVEGLYLDEANEELHCIRITALMHQKKHRLAMECYEQATKALYDTLGVRESAHLKAIYEELLSLSKGSDAEGLEAVHEDMQEKEEPEGAYICGYPVFQAIYRLEARKNSRAGEPQYVMLLTLVRREEGGTCNAQMAKYIINRGMEQMEEVLKNVLRIGDMAARYSDSQYLILLPACNRESCGRVAERILKHFGEKNKGNKLMVKTEYEEIMTASAWIK